MFLPPVIFTSDQELLEVDFGEGIILHVPKIKGESNYSTLAWLDAVKDYLLDEPFLLMDNHFSHHNPKFLDTLKELDIQYDYFPIPCTALCSPLDNSLHSELRRRYLTKARESHVEMIKAMIEAYYEIPTDHIKKYWSHVGKNQQDQALIHCNQTFGRWIPSYITAACC